MNERGKETDGTESVTVQKTYRLIPALVSYSECETCEIKSCSDYFWAFQIAFIAVR